MPASSCPAARPHQLRPPCPRSFSPKTMTPGLAVICASLAASRGSNARTMPCIANRPKRRGAPTARREARAGNGGWPPSDINIARRSSAPLEKPLQARVADEGRETDLHHIHFPPPNHPLYPPPPTTP